MVDERVLQRVEAVGALEPLDGGHVTPLHLDDEVRARAHRRAVDQHRARAAHLHVAGALGALQLEAITQDVEQ